MSFRKLYHSLFISGLLFCNNIFAQDAIVLNLPTDTKCNYVVNTRPSNIEYYKLFKLQWSGQCNENGNLEGEGKLSYVHSNGNKGFFAGPFKNGRENGEFIEFTENTQHVINYKVLYENQVKIYGAKLTHDKLTNILTTYTGPFKGGKFNGPGLLITIEPNGKTYQIEGNFIDGLLQGNGKFTWLNTNIYWEGNFTDGKLNGKGIQTHPDKSTKIFEYANNQLVTNNNGDGTDAHYFCVANGFVLSTVGYAKCRTYYVENEKSKNNIKEAEESYARVLSNISNQLNKNSANLIANQANQTNQANQANQKILIDQQSELLKQQSELADILKREAQKKSFEPTELLKPLLFDKNGRPIKN